MNNCEVNWDDIRDEIITNTKDMMGHTDYREIGEQLTGYIDGGHQKETKKIITALLHEYQNRPALIYELEKLMTEQEIAEFKNWRKNSPHKSNLKCTKCGSKKIVRVAYGFPSEELFRSAEMGRVHLGGCVVGYDKYFCNNCETYYADKPTDRNAQKGPIIITNESDEYFLTVSDNK